MASQTCPQCHAPIVANEQFCRECGTRVAGTNPSWPNQGQYDPATPPIGSAPPPPPQDNWSYPQMPQQGGYPPQGGYQQQGGYPPQGGYPSQQPSKSRTSTPLIIGMILAAVLLGGIGTFLIVGNKDSKDPSSTAVVAIQPTRTPRPTPTARPTATAEPTPDTIVVIDDDFSSKDEGWPEGPTNSQTGSYEYLDDAYQINIDVIERIIWTSTIETYDDFDATIDVMITEGDPTNVAGLLFREQDVGGFYVFQVSPVGDYSMRRFDRITLNEDEQWQILSGDGSGWTETSVINKGLNEVNRLRVVANGSTFELYINGELVETVVDDGLDSGYIGFGASTFDISGSKNVFDNFRLEVKP